MLAPELVWEDGLMMYQGSRIKGMPIGPGNPHQSTLPFLTTSPTTLLPMSSSTFFNNTSDGENTQQFWEGAPSGLATQSPRRERHPSTHPVFSRLDIPTPTGPACKGIPQTCRPQCCAPINNNSTRCTAHTGWTLGGRLERYGGWGESPRLR